ncbi:hypothetical protein HY625_00815 [Candidatus Uhrbacteria bacterium]|nr:hypothetical protein [Candidatus Uhrbacteria bacterium]
MITPHQSSIMIDHYSRTVLGNAFGCDWTEAARITQLGTGCSLLQPLGLHYRLPLWATMAKGGGML